MEIKYLPLAKEHRSYWIKTGNKRIQERISRLIEDILKHPYEGLGKPHALKHALSGSWAREINKKDRLVYEVKEDTIVEIQRMKGHYSDK